jgi:hypothetical protein
MFPDCFRLPSRTLARPCPFPNNKIALASDLLAIKECGNRNEIVLAVVLVIGLWAHYAGVGRHARDGSGF